MAEIRLSWHATNGWFGSFKVLKFVIHLADINPNISSHHAGTDRELGLLFYGDLSLLESWKHLAQGRQHLGKPWN